MHAIDHILYLDFPLLKFFISSVPPAIADIENADDIDDEPDGEPSSCSLLGKLVQDGTALLIAAVAKVKQAAAAARAKTWASGGNQGPAQEAR